ncbi:hypothetical protein EDB80DRAFT_684643 [Ilyonectria destructans]|nr:hypothetical protein EDB80DRAFT_684643 [Ilyonectria destructans]
MTGAIIHLDHAIDVMPKILQDVAEYDENQATWSGNLACYLEARFDRTSANRDLDEAIRLERQSVEATPEDLMHRGPLLHTLADGLNKRYDRKAELHDLEEAIQLVFEAVQTTPKSHEKKPALLHLLGTLLQSRYFAAGRTVDLDIAVEMFGGSVETSEARSPDRRGSSILSARSWARA